MTRPRPDAALVADALRAGDIDRLEGYAEALEQFPCGNGPGGGPWLRLVAAIGSVAAVAWALARCRDLAEPENYDFTTLQSCLDRPEVDRYEVLAMLIAAGVDLNARGMNDWTALHHAALRDDFRAIRMLIDAGADRAVRTRIDDRATAEEEARNLGHLEAADLIRDHRPPRGGKPGARDRRRARKRGE